jgi:hypothetical protein
MFIVHIEGGDPFIARSKPAVIRGLDDLLKGEVINKSFTPDCFRVLYKDNCGQLLNIVADRSEVYK